jgi:uncharacterized Zn finger protein (UPF0148 family)
VTDKCPYCDFEAEDAHAEIAHMETRHPEIIRERLEKAGLPAPEPVCKECGHILAGHRGDGVCLHCGCEAGSVWRLYEAQTENYTEENEARARAETERDKLLEGYGELREENAVLRKIIGRLYEQRGKDITTLRTAIRRAFRDANDG